jgi:hypothetical protein
MTKTKIDRIRTHLATGRSITALEAISLYSCFRLASVIHDLRRSGYKISTLMKTDMNGTEYAEYRIIKQRAA